MQWLIMGPVAGALLALGGLDFTEFSPKEGGFSVLMPGKPVRKEQTAAGLKVVMYLVEVKDSAYIVGSTDLPPGAPGDLEGGVQGAVNSVKGKVLTKTDFKLDGHPGKEFEAEINRPKGYLSGRLLVVGGRLYQVQAVGTNARLSNPDVRKFLDSFKLKK